MIDDRLIEAAAAGAKRASVHAMRAGAEIVAALMVFAEEIGKALDDDDDVAPEHIEVEDDDA